jgi:ribosome-binding factor A
MDQKRFERVKELIHQEVSGYISEIVKNPKVIVSVTATRLSSNLDFLDIYLSIFPKSDSMLNTIQKKKSTMEKKIFKNLNLRKTPKVRIFSSEKFESLNNVLDIIKKAEKELAEKNFEDTRF